MFRRVAIVCFYVSVVLSMSVMFYACSVVTSLGGAAL